MIAGIGLDLCEVERMSKACQSEAFKRRVFSEAERAYAAQKASQPLHLAGAFAAKEAFAKATGLGLGKIGLQNVSVVHDEGGVPRLRLDPGAAALHPFLKGRFHLSITHDGGYAAAVVIYETEEERDDH
jgi:holo-[acyl-carrier protein] synthase